MNDIVGPDDLLLIGGNDLLEKMLLAFIGGIPIRGGVIGRERKCFKEGVDCSFSLSGGNNGRHCRRRAGQALQGYLFLGQSLQQHTRDLGTLVMGKDGEGVDVTMKIHCCCATEVDFHKRSSGAAG